MHWSFQPPQDPAGIAKEASRKLDDLTHLIWLSSFEWLVIPSSGAAPYLCGASSHPD